MPLTKKESLGEKLKQAGLLSAEQFTQALAEERKTGEPLRHIVIEKGWITDAKMISFLSDWLSLPMLDLKNTRVEPDVIKLVPEGIARKHQVLPVFRLGNSITVVVSDPFNTRGLDAVREKTQLSVESALATPKEIQKAIEEIYAASGNLADVFQNTDLKSLGVKKGVELELKKLRGIVEEPPVIKMVNLLLVQAMWDKASDIHIEPGDEQMQIRFRIDGSLQKAPAPPAEFHAPIISRLKIMANLDIAERRTPQDGRFRVNLENRPVDVRVSIVPTINGEKAVLRILDSGSLQLGLEKLGLSMELLKAWKDVLARPYGLVLATGPTGSGKTTTLYTSLHFLNSTERHIITIEDPVEYRLAGIQQIQVNPQIDLTFSAGLRAILRQDPNIVMVGEIRDRETAEIAVHAALTGHLVFSSLHTNDAPGAVTRLIDMGVEPFLAASALQAVLAQRLLRLLCSECKKPADVPAALRQRLGLNDGPGNGGTPFFKPVGCTACRGHGYRGRVAIFELLLPDDDIRQAISTRVPTEKIRAMAKSKGMKTLRDSALEMVRRGEATLEDVVQLTMA